MTDDAVPADTLVNRLYMEARLLEHDPSRNRTRYLLREAAAENERLADESADRLRKLGLLMDEMGRFQERERDLRAETKWLRAALEDFRDRGLRYDLNPTRIWESHNQAVLDEYMTWRDYMAGADKNVRERARRALEGGEG